ncbi:MAG: DUF6291 domain-containing protein [Oscillospiraceae bacterium]|nr:DUF6291 domain-containing protein [Oscillospiraceae bacterium]
MSEEKKSFILYCTWEEQIELLDMTQRGELLTALFAYENRGECYDGGDKLIMMAFRAMRVAMDENRAKWEARAQRSRENGALGGRPKKNRAGSMGFDPKTGKPVSVNEKENESVFSSVSGAPKPRSDTVFLKEYMRQMHEAEAQAAE